VPPQGSSLEEGHGRIRTSLADRQIQEAIFLKLQNDTDLQTEVRTHCPITFIRLQSINKVEKIFRASPAGGKLSFLGEEFPQEMSR